MSEESPHAVLLPEATEARFSIRALLGVMAVVALIAAGVGPIVRRLEPDAQVRLLTFWAVWLIAAVLWIAFQARRRFQAEKIAGRTLLRLPMFDERVPHATSVRHKINVAAAVLISLITWCTMSFMVLDPPTSGGPWMIIWTHGVMSLLCAWWIGKVVAMLWWRSNSRLCESGVLWDQQVLLWDHIIEWRWDDSDATVLELKGIDQRNMDALLKIPVPKENRDEVDVILNTKSAHRPSVPLGLTPYELGRAPISKAIRSPHFLRYLSRVLLGVVVFLAVFYLLLTGPTGVREFDQSIIVGFLVSMLFRSWRWHLTGKRAGAPLVRLSGRRSWWELVPVVVAATAIYVIGRNFGWSSEWLAYATGIGFGWVSETAITYIAWTQLDLSGNGLVLLGTMYWPWAHVKILKCDRKNGGRLVLGRGWRRVIATVPPEQQEAVGSVLREKLRPESKA